MSEPKGQNFVKNSDQKSFDEKTLADGPQKAPDSPATVVLTTAPATAAAALAKHLVEEGLVACVNIVPTVQSVYFWEGKVVSDEESLLVMKTVRENYVQLEKRIKELHSYEVPEIIALSVDAGSKEYLDWLSATISRKSASASQ